MKNPRYCIKQIVNRLYAHPLTNPLFRHWIEAGTAYRQIAARLRNHGDAGSINLVNAMEKSLRFSRTGDESVWIDRIEALRSRLTTSREPVHLIDYGAGSANDNRSRTQSAQGVHVDRTVGEVAAGCSKTPPWAFFLFSLIRSFKPSTAVELGTCVGISAAYQGAALQLNGKGKLFTLEGSPSLAALSRNNLNSLGISPVEVIEGRFQDTLDSVLKNHAPVDYAFIDGHHDEAATVEYFQQFLPVLSPGAVVVFDDIAWSPGMKRAWKRIASHEAVSIALDLHSIGVCLVGLEAVEKLNLTMRPVKIKFGFPFSFSVRSR